ncbi:unnamed protein product, partial [Callosobruchus maculatus]
GLCVITTNKQRARNHLEKKNYVFIIETANKTMVGTMKNLTNFNLLRLIIENILNQDGSEDRATPSLTRVQENICSLLCVLQFKIGIF